MSPVRIGAGAWRTGELLTGWNSSIQRNLEDLPLSWDDCKQPHCGEDQYPDSKWFLNKNNRKKLTV